MSNFSELDDMMGYNALNTDIFAKPAANAGNPNIYRTNPKDTKAEDGHYHCKLRVLYNPFDKRRTIVHSEMISLRDADGYLTVKSSLSDAEDQNSPYFRDAKKCPIFTQWKKVRFNDKLSDEVKEAAKKWWNENKRSADYILVQVIEDKNQPEWVGRIAPWKIPSTVLKKVESKRNPSKDSGKVSVDVLNYLTGRVLDVEVVPGPDDPKDRSRYFREISYDLCEFDSEVCPIIKVDGTPLFTDEEVELIEKYDKKLTAIAKMKSPEERDKSYELLKANKLFEDIKALMKRAIDYVKENAINLVDECAYKPWDEETTARVNAIMKEYVASNGSPKFGDADTTEMSENPDLNPGSNMPDPMGIMDDAEADPFEEHNSVDDDLPF